MKDWEYIERKMWNFKIGRNAEDIVELIFLGSGRKIYRNGIEQSLRALGIFIEGFIEGMNEAFKMPDYLVVDIHGERSLVDVKFRRSGHFYREDLKILECHRDIYAPVIILVSCNLNPNKEVPYFQVVPPPYRLDDEYWPIDAVPLIRIEKWNLDLNVHDLACKWVQNDFSALPY